MDQLHHKSRVYPCFVSCQEHLGRERDPAFLIARFKSPVKYQVTWLRPRERTRDPGCEVVYGALTRACAGEISVSTDWPISLIQILISPKPNKAILLLQENKAILFKQNSMKNISWLYISSAQSQCWRAINQSSPVQEVSVFVPVAKKEPRLAQADGRIHLLLWLPML